MHKKTFVPSIFHCKSKRLFSSILEVIVSELLLCPADSQPNTCPGASRRGLSTSRSKPTSRRRMAECRRTAGVCLRNTK